MDQHQALHFHFSVVLQSDVHCQVPSRIVAPHKNFSLLHILLGKNLFSRGALLVALVLKPLEDVYTLVFLDRKLELGGEIVVNAYDNGLSAVANPLHDTIIAFKGEDDKAPSVEVNKYLGKLLREVSLPSGYVVCLFIWEINFDLCVLRRNNYFLGLINI